MATQESTARGCSDLASERQNKRPSTILSALGALCILAAILLALVAGTDLTGEPVGLVLMPTSKNFGSVEQGAKLQYSFQLHNHFNVPLDIVDVTSDCGCTGAVVGQRHLDPDSSTEVRVSLDTAGYRGDIQKLVDLRYRLSNSDSDGHLLLTVASQVMPTYHVSHEKITFDRTIPSQRQVRIWPADGFDVQLQRASVVDPAFTVTTSVDSAWNADGRVVTVEFDPSKLRDSSRSSELILYTSSTTEPVYRISIYVSPAVGGTSHQFEEKETWHAIYDSRCILCLADVHHASRALVGGSEL